jgi:hypothetical protein
VKLPAQTSFSEPPVRHRFVFLLVLLFPFTVPLSAQTVSCSSDDGEKHYCEADTRYGAHLLRQTSTAECAEGKTWGWDEEGVWVNKGCAGQFTLGKTEPALEPAPEKHPPMKDNSAEKKEMRLTCMSNDGRRNYCDADTKGAMVKLLRQTGPSPCVEDSTWGHDDKGIWVDRGCRGEFAILPQGGAGDVSCEKSMGKKEARKLVDQCLQISPATHPPCNVANSCVLIKEEIKRSCALVAKDAPKFCEEYK